MRRLQVVSVVLGSLILYSAPVWAQEELTVPPPPPALLQEPSEAVSVIKQAIDYLGPTYGTCLDVWNGEASQCISASVYNFHDNAIKVASLRVGATTGLTAYSGLGLDVEGIVLRYFPDVVKDTLSPPPVTPVWGFLGKYSHLGVGGGFSFDHDDPAVVLEAGVKGRF